MKIDEGMTKEDLKLSKITSEYGYKIYKNAKERFPEDTDEDFSKIMNSLESSLIYFMGNECNPEMIDNLCEIICESLRKNSKRVKDHAMEKYKEDKYLFSKELRERMSKFGDRDVSDCLRDRSFYDALLDHAGYTEKEKDKVWNEINKKSK